MTRFEIKDDFYLDGQPFKILSGAIHYFRVEPNDWYASLYNLKALGFNTVETYVPWNSHEKVQGRFDFEGRLDLEAFLDLAQSLGLYAIVRASPYICAEWHFGGLPSWLLNKPYRPRSSDKGFLEDLGRYYDVLIPKLRRHELDQGGNILMFQVENEYGSYGEDKAYLRAIKSLMEERGLTQPFFTSDGSWHAALEAGSLIEDDVLVTGNFGSKPEENFKQMQAFFDLHGKKWPLMCMEFWDGWFNRWGEAIIKRDPEDLVTDVMNLLELGSINLYMFHGGTNFGFTNGCSARGQKDLPQITSYDYDAILDEAGNPTKKFYLLQEALKKRYPDLAYSEPLVKDFLETGSIACQGKVSLFSLVEELDGQVSRDPLSMEALGHGEGYAFYQTTVTAPEARDERLRVIDGRDRVQIYGQGKHLKTQYQDEIGEDVPFRLESSSYTFQFLVENMGRVNYGHKLLAPTQFKGLGRGVMLDLHFISGWENYALPLDDLSFVDFSKEWQPDQPGFYRYTFDVAEPKASYLDVSHFGKGCVFLNGQALGRFWDRGPTLSLYVPKGFFKKGQNELIIFETEGRYQDLIQFRHQPLYKECEE